MNMRYKKSGCHGSDLRNQGGKLAPDSGRLGISCEERLLPERAWVDEANLAIERARNEEAFRRSEAYLAEAQKLSHTGSFGWNVTTRSLVWSAETFRILEYEETSSPTLGMVLNRVHPEDRPLVQEAIQAASEGERVLDFELRLLMPDGSIKHLHVLGHASEDVSGGIEFLGAVTDVSEQRKAQEALSASEHLARGQVEALTSTLASLAEESDPERLLEYVLRTIVEQTQAQSVAAWNRNDDGMRFDLIAVIENGQYQARKAAIHPATRLSMLPEHHPVWRELLQTAQHGMMDDLDKKSARMCIGGGDWRTVPDDLAPDPAFTILMNHLREMGVRTVLFVPFLIAGKVIGTLAIRFQEKRAFRREEIDLTRALAHQAMLALELVRLSRQSRQAAVMAERNRMARDIHDTLAQGFTGVIVQLEAVDEAMSKGLTAKAGECLRRAGALARESLQEARRSVRALRLRSVEEMDLCEALQDLVRKMTTNTSLSAEFSVWGQPPELPPEWEDNLLRIGQEVLTNVLRHAHASKFKARLSFEKESIRLDLCDNGKGFDQAGRHDGFGLLGIEERAQAMGGQVTIQSVKNRGTAISVLLPQPHTLNTLER